MFVFHKSLNYAFCRQIMKLLLKIKQKIISVRNADIDFIALSSQYCRIMFPFNGIRFIL
jgi:hypothetical protein